MLKTSCKDVCLQHKGIPKSIPSSLLALDRAQLARVQGSIRVALELGALGPGTLELGGLDPKTLELGGLNPGIGGLDPGTLKLKGLEP